MKHLTDSEKDLIIAFTYGKGWTADRITRELFNLSSFTKEFYARRKQVTRYLDEIESKMNCKELRLMELLEKSDEILKQYYTKRGSLNLTVGV